MMRDRFLCNILNEIDETYINEAIDVQQNRKKHNMFFIPIAASIAFFVLTGVLFLRKGSELHEGPIDMITAELEEHSFALMVYAAEDSTNMLKVNPEEAHEYIISSNKGRVANKFYSLTSNQEMPEAMIDRIDSSEEIVICYGFNMRIEGEGIENITFESEKLEFAKKIEYGWMKDRDIFEEYPDCLGIASKEYYNGSGGTVYENCGNEENSHWIFVPVGNRYTVPYEKQGDSENLYALQLVYDRQQIEDAQEYSRTHIEDNFQTINDILINGVLGQEIKIIVTYEDGCKDELIIEITRSSGICMEIQIKEIVKVFNDFKDVPETIENKNGIFHLKQMDRIENKWKVIYKLTN